MDITRIQSEVKTSSLESKKESTRKTEAVMGRMKSLITGLDKQTSEEDETSGISRSRCFHSNIQERPPPSEDRKDARDWLGFCNTYVVVNEDDSYNTNTVITTDSMEEGPSIPNHNRRKIHGETVCEENKCPVFGAKLLEVDLDTFQRSTSNQSTIEESRKNSRTEDFEIKREAAKDTEAERPKQPLSPVNQFRRTRNILRMPVVTAAILSATGRQSMRIISGRAPVALKPLQENCKWKKI